MATEIRYNVNAVRHDNHIATVGLTKRTFISPINTLLVINTSSSVSAYISFDGTNSLTIPPNGSFSMDFNKRPDYWTASDGTAVLQVVTGSEY